MGDWLVYVAWFVVPAMALWAMTLPMHLLFVFTVFGDMGPKPKAGSGKEGGWAP